MGIGYVNNNQTFNNTGFKTNSSNNNSVNNINNLNNSTSSEKVSYSEFLEKYKSEVTEKVVNGETEPTYQIGASEFTEHEWDKLLAGFDRAEEELRKLREERKLENEEKAEKKEILQEQIENEEEYLSNISGEEEKEKFIG